MSAAPFELPGYRLTPFQSNREYRLYRAVREIDGARVLVVTPTSDDPPAATVGRLETAFRVRHVLSDAWAITPREMQWIGPRPLQIIFDPGGQMLTEIVGGPLDPERCLQSAVAVAEALEHVHEAGIVHRDLKPGLIMVKPAQTRAWIGGFGHALLEPFDAATDSIIGTIAYMPPEQTGRMDRAVDRRSDLYALGVILFELFTGTRPFDTRDAKELIFCHLARRPPRVETRTSWAPPVLGAIVEKLLEKSPDARYQTASGLARDLRRCLGEWSEAGTITSFSIGEHDARVARAGVRTRGGLVSGSPLPISTTVVGGAERLDIAALVEVSTALSGELGLEALIGKLLSIVLEQSGGQRVLLVSGDGMTLRAKAHATDDKVVVDTIPLPLSEADAAGSVLRRAAEANRIVSVDDASIAPETEGDRAWRPARHRSVLCVPLVHRGRALGFLYIENDLVSHAFGTRRVAFLNALATHAASALATATLYAELDGSEARYRFLFDNVPLAIVQIDTRGYRGVFDELRAAGEDIEEWVRYSPDFLDRLGPFILGRIANPACARLFGVATVEEVLRPLGALWKPGTDTLRRSVLARLAGKKGHAERTKLETLDRRIIDVLFFIAFRDPKDAERPLDIVSMVDLNDLVAAERKLETMQNEFAHASRVSMLGELTASLAHEINQPLMAIQANASAARRWVERDVPNTEKAREATLRIRAEATRAGEIVSRISSMAINAAPQRSRSSINEIIEEATQFLQYEIRSRGVSLVLELTPERPLVNADRVQIQQVLVNLAVNAMQAIARGPSTGNRVLVRSTVDGAAVHISVEDSGPGLAAETAGRLFEGFFSTRQGGMGMGLRICRSLVEAHDGNVEARNGPNGGAVFSFTLPVVHDEHASET